MNIFGKMFIIRVFECTTSKIVHLKDDPMAKTDRRVQRTRELLQKALIELINDHHYDDITIQDIVDRANVGRTTFYLHYNSKEELFSSCHGNIVSEFHFGPLHPLSRGEILAPEAPMGIIFAYKHLEEGRGRLNTVFQGRDGQLILRRIRDMSAQVALMQWWLEKRQPYTPEHMAQTFHRLQRAAIRDAFRLKDAD
jgi:AcrR family transcriptional regulator